MQFDDEINCLKYLKENDLFTEKQHGGCNGTFDGILCFKGINANTTLSVPCPNIPGVFDTTKQLFKECLPNGMWKCNGITNRSSGYTDYGMCLTDSAHKEYMLRANIENYEYVLSFVRYEEVVGSCLSILCLLFTLFIYLKNRSLLCYRTVIHINLFVAILLQSFLRLIFFVDGYLYNKKEKVVSSYSLKSMEYSVKICPIMMAFLEYFQSCTFMWMMCEGIYLNYLLAYTVKEKHNILTVCFYFIGWVLPAVIVPVWFFNKHSILGFDEVCWFGYYDEDIYWIIEGPILVALLISSFGLINVIRIVVGQLRNDQSENHRYFNNLKKSLKATCLLLPLLGVTHLFELWHDSPNNYILFVLYKVTEAFLAFYNGAILSIGYCFMNKEVREVLKRHGRKDSNVQMCKSQIL